MTAPSERGVARPRTAVVLGVIAALAGGFAALALWRAPAVEYGAGALALHVAAAATAWAAARLAGGTQSECDLVLALALAAPGFGPALAWTAALSRRRDAAQNAHAAFEAQEAHVEAADRPTLARELQVVSHAHVLEHGSLEQKRNLLRQLARIGERRYLLLLRRFLLDPEPELRLCAYAELARECQQQESRIRELRERAEARTDGDTLAAARALAELAEANRAYAASGLLDSDMARYWLGQAQALAERALGADPDCRAAQSVLARTLAEAGELERAWELIVAWPDDVEPEHDVVRAELAFRRRDRGRCLDVARRLAARGVEPPVWLGAVVGTGSAAAAEVAP